MRRDEAAIDDGRDERIRASASTSSTAADIDPPRHQQWFVEGYGFGVKHLTGP